MNYSSPLLTTARQVGQKLHVLKPLQRAYRRLLNSSYEEKFDKALMDAIGPKDVVWDIGANVGYYTTRFADKTGSDGAVFAFEPAPISAQTIRDVCKTRHQVTVLEIALSNVRGTAAFTVGEDTAPTNSLSSAATKDKRTYVDVSVDTGDNVVAELLALFPTVIKIDVEGYELEVLQGMPSILSNRILQTVCMEIHFTVLNRRGLLKAPQQIVSLLGKSGLRVQWIDPSHLVASRH